MVANEDVHDIARLSQGLSIALLWTGSRYRQPQPKVKSSRPALARLERRGIDDIVEIVFQGRMGGLHFVS